MSYRSRLHDFHDLMRHRIMDVLLVASPYDSFILEEAGQIAERVLGEFRNLDLHYGPGITGVSTGAEALELARHKRYGLIITTLRLGDMSGAELARRVAEGGLGVPVVLLAFDNRELKDLLARADLSAVERVFLWQGDARILLAIVKCVEDRLNAEHDTRALGVQVILLIEDNVRYYSSFLPTIYAELLNHSQRVIGEGLNLSDKITRMRARPKVLLCGTWEEAWDAFTAYQQDILGVISDVEFPRAGQRAEDAGIELAKRVRERWPDVPVLLHSSRPANERFALDAGASFLLKGSPLLLAGLRRFMTEYLAFGDFVFRLPDGTEVGRARDMKGLEEALRSVPAASVAYHSERNHFSKWLKARTEFSLAHELRPRQVSDFPDLEALRQNLIDSIAAYRRERARTGIADFDRASFDGAAEFYRIGGGSIGGKARGLAFMRRLLVQGRVAHGLPGVEIAVPPAAVLGTDVFDRFVDENHLGDLAIHGDDDPALVERFQKAPFPEDALLDLATFLARATYPIAVRSSSLLEDSQYQPFTGVYETFMLANDQASLEERLARLVRAVKRVYASTFSSHSKAYIKATPYRLEEEKMAVIVQRIVGSGHGSRFYPSFAGVARSHNFYPTPPMTAADGIAAVALGFGRSVVEEGSCLRFCPKYPRHVLQSASVDEALRNSQRAFWALTLGAAADAGPDAGLRETRFELEVAEADGTLGPVASTFSRENQSISDGIGRPGIRLVTFAPVLKHGAFPLAEALARLLEVGAWGLGAPVEIEFAVDLPAQPAQPAQFGFLQLRPLALSRETEELRIEAVEPERLVCRSASVLGNGRIDDVHDVVVVDWQRFERSLSQATAADLSRFNAELGAEARPYLLIGVGRWGSSDPWLGIPVSWDQISGARVIVEAGFRDVKVTPSQGTHFFQNLTSFNVGYFTVNPDAGEGFVDWDWLAAQPAVREAGSVRHLRFARPLLVKMDGKRSQGVILKPS